MVTFDLTCNKKGYGSIPKALRNSWGGQLSIIPNDNAGVIYPKNADLSDVKRSLEILILDIEHRIEINNKKNQEGEQEVEREGGE